MVMQTRKAKYTHLPLGIDVEAFAGYYTPEKEGCLEYDGRQILYVTGHVVVESTCGANNSCTTANYWYALIPGYIVGWQVEKNKAGLPVTEVELIREEKTQTAIRDRLMKIEPVSRVDFW